MATNVRFVFPSRGRWHSIGHRTRRNDFNPPGFLGSRDRSPCIRSSKILLHAEVVATQKGQRKENEGSKGESERKRERGLTRSGTRGTREASGKKPSAIAIRTNIRSRDERRTNKEKRASEKKREREKDREREEEQARERER